MKKRIVFKTITGRIVTLIAPILSISIIIFIIVVQSVVDRQIKKSYTNAIEESISVASLNIENSLLGNADVAEALSNYAESINLLTNSEIEIEKFVTKQILSNSDTVGGGIWYMKDYPSVGNEYVSYYGYLLNDHMEFIRDYGDSIDFYAEEWFLNGQNTTEDVVWSNPYIDLVANIIMVTATSPIYDDAGHFIGVATADMSLHNIEIMAGEIKIGDTGDLFILSGEGNYITFFDDTRAFNSPSIKSDSNDQLAGLGAEIYSDTSNEELNKTFINYSGSKKQVFYSTIPNVNWRLVVAINYSEISGSSTQLVLLMSLVPIIGLILCYLAILSLTRYFNKVVNKVNEFSKLTSVDEFTKRINVTESDEFGIMEVHLNDMMNTMSNLHSHSMEMVSIAQAASQAKGEFLSRMSHEIRTPMNAILGMTQIANNTSDMPKIKDCLQKISVSSNQLLSLINNILDMSKIEANKLILEEHNYSLREAIDDIITITNVKALEKNQTITTRISDNIPQEIFGDKLRYSQVSLNFLSNAVKFTPSGGKIIFEVAIINEDDDYMEIETKIIDNGIGMTEAQANRVFEPFEQADGSITRKYGGTGLGLTISKSIIELMGGNVIVKSEINVGSSFIFTLKVEKVINKDNLELNLNCKVETTYKLLLICCDNKCDVATINKDMTYEIVNSIAAAEKNILNGKCYENIIINYQDVNKTALERICKMTKGKCNIALLISSSAWKSIDYQYVEMGITTYIIGALTNDKINEFLNNQPVISTDAIPDFTNKKILLVEDIEINREIVESLLEETNAKIDSAENGIIACELVNDKTNKYDLILMDMQMPEMNGIDATIAIRNMPQGELIPILAMTANAFKDDIESCHAAGMNDHISKPIDFDLLMNKLHYYLINNKIIK